MPYKIYTDKNENFECEVSVKNASLKGSKARLVVESADGTNLIFHGKIENGKCIVPIKRVKGLLDENSTGEMSLEVIVEDTYFKPWHDSFLVEEHTSVKVTVNEQKISTKPTVTVKVPQHAPKIPKSQVVPIMELTNLCRKFGFTRRNISQYKDSFRQMINEYFKSNPEFLNHKKSVLETVRYLLK